MEKNEEKVSLLYSFMAELNKCLSTHTTPSAEISARIEETLFMAEDYRELRDEYVQLIQKCFRFQQHEIKKIAYLFTRKLMDKGIIEASLIISLLSGGYLSSKTYNLLKDYKVEITNLGIGQVISSKLKSIKDEGGDKRWSESKKEMQFFPINEDKLALLNELIELYS